MPYYIDVFHVDDWKCDQYQWRNYGRKKLQTSPVIVKTYYVFVHNDGRDDPAFKRCASVLKELQTSEVAPYVTYKRKIATSISSIEHQSVLLPKNVKQVKNLQSSQRQKMRISHDSLYNIHEIAYDLKDFVHQITTYPDLVVVCGVRKLLGETNRLLQLGNSSQLLSYDTTFKLGDFYVSPVVFRNVIFKKSPIMPAMFLVHERKLRSTHNDLMTSIARELPCVVNGRHVIPMVTDEEKGFEAIEQHLHKVRRLFCWNHIINSAKAWLKSIALHCILGDGNCLFRSLSYIMHQTESRHAEIRAELVQFTLLNRNYFSGYCKPLTVEMHTRNMKNNCIWGTHVEIYALIISVLENSCVCCFRQR